MTAIPDPLDVLQEAVEWLTSFEGWAENADGTIEPDIYCQACDSFNGHKTDCPVPRMGAAWLRAQHWYERRWCGYEYSEGGWLKGRFRLDRCHRHPTHDDGAHEPREDEMR